MKRDPIVSESYHVIGWMSIPAVVTGLVVFIILFVANLNTAECRTGDSFGRYGELGSAASPNSQHILLAGSRYSTPTSSRGSEGGVHRTPRRPSGGGGVGISIRIPLSIPRVIPGRYAPAGSYTPGDVGPGKEWNPKESWESVGFDGESKSRKASEKTPPTPRQPQTARTAPTKRTPAVVPVDNSHPENDGSIDARKYFMQVLLVMDEGLPEFVWRDHKAALKLYQSALNDLLKLPYKSGQIKGYLNLGNVYFLIGDFQEAVENYKKALALSAATGELTSKASLLGNIGCAIWASGEYESAEGYFGEALAAYESLQDVTGQSNTLINAGVLEQNRGNLDTATEKYRNAIALAPKNSKGAIHAKRHIAQAYRMQGRFALSETAYLEALELSKEIKNLKLQMEILADLGSLFTEWGRVQRQPNRYQAAIDKLTLALEISDRMGLPGLYLKKLIGDLYLETGDAQRAESYLVAAGFKSSLGRLYLARNDYEAAKSRFDLLLRSSQGNKRMEDILASATGLGQVYEAAGDYAKAEKYYLEGMGAAEEIRDGKLLSERWNFFAVPINGYLPSEPAKGVTRVRIKNGIKLGSTDQTIYPSEVTKARKFTDHIALKADLSHFNVPNELKHQEDNLLARRASLLKAQSLITRAQDPQLYDDKGKEIQEVEGNIKQLVATLWQRYPEYASARHPKPVELNQAALDLDEYVVVFDVLGEAVSARLLRGSKVERVALVDLNRRDLEEQVDRLRKPLDNHEQVDPARLQVYDVRLAKVLYDRLLSDVLQDVPNGTSVTIVPDEILGKVPFEALVVRGEASWQKEDIYPFPQGITYAGDLYPFNYHQSVTSLTLARTLHRSSTAQDKLLVMADPTYDASDPRLSGGAGDSEAPVKAQASLPPGERPVISKSVPPERTMAPVAGQIRRKVERGRDEEGSFRVAARESSREHPAGQRVTPAPVDDSGGYAFTWPRLELTGSLGVAIKEMYPNQTDLYLGRDADKSVLLNSPLRSYNAIVFGTHGYFGQDIPGVMEPVLVLNMVPDSDKGYLRMSEVMGLDLDADFVALTACKTGLGEYLVGEGILSMGRAFQYAGARSVLMSLWTVPEEASVALVENFMRNLREGRSKSDALAMARTEVRKLKKHYGHPFYWASFVLVGDAVPQADPSTFARVAKGVGEKKSHTEQDPYNVLEQGKALQFRARSKRDNEKAREQMEQALRLFERENSRKGIEYSLVALADFHSNLGEYDRASDYLTQYVRRAETGESLRSQARARIRLGEAFAASNKYDKAEEQFTRSLDLFEMVGDVEGKVDVLNRLGRVYGLQARPAEAIGYLEKALRVTRNQGDVAGEAMTLMNLASVNAAASQYQEAIEYYQESLSAYRKLGRLGDTVGLDGEMEALQGLASVFESQGRSDLAKEHFNKALDLAKKGEVSARKSKQPKQLLDAYTSLGKVYEKMGDLKKAEQYYSKALKEAESVSKNTKKTAKGSQIKSQAGVLDASEAIKGLDRIKVKTEKKKAKTAAVSRG